MQRSFSGLLVVVAAVTAACDVSVGGTGVSFGIAKGKAQDEWTRTYRLPRGGHFEISNVNGSIDALPADGTQVEVRAERIASADNDDAARDVLRNLRTTGESSITGDVDVQTANGAIRLGLPADARATLNARCINGGVSLDYRLPLHVTEMSRRRVAGTFNGGGPRISASTINGAIRVVARGAV